MRNRSNVVAALLARMLIRWYMDFDAVEGALAFKHNRKLKFERKIGNGEAGLSDDAQAAAKAQRQLRRFARHRFDARIQVSVFREGMTTTCWGRTSELGEDGIGATLSAELQAGEVVSVQFPIPFPPHLIKVRAVVRYSDGLRCGFEFLVVTDEQKLILREVCVVLANAS
jgi:hypothetical protein